MSCGFRTTRWSVVIAAADGGTEESRAALADLAEAYWYPLYAYARRRGLAPETAEDRTQSFFADLLEKNGIRHADPERGRFRAFLLASFRHHLGHEGARERAAKRGGGRSVLPLDYTEGERRYAREPSHDETPERLFERRWALTLLSRVLDGLREEMEARGKGEAFALLGPAIGTAGELPPYAELAARLGSTEGAVKVAIHRLRARYRERLRAEIAETVAGQEEVDAEIRHLLAAVGA